MSRKSRAKPPSPFRCFNSSPEVIRLVVMMYVRFPLSLRNVEDLLFERGIDLCHETVRMWWNRFGPIFAGDIRRQRMSRMKGFRQWRWHLDEMYVKLNGEMVYLWRAVDQEGEILESFTYISSRCQRHCRKPRMRETRCRRMSPENSGPNRFHQCRTVSWHRSIPRSNSRSSTFLSDKGNRTYIITTRRITSGDELK